MLIYTAKAFKKIHYLGISESQLLKCIDEGTILIETHKSKGSLISEREVESDSVKVQLGNIFVRYKISDEERIILDIYKREV